MHQKQNRFFTVPRVILGVLLLIFIFLGASVWYARRNALDLSGAITVKKGTITQEVMVTGKTAPAENVTLSFEKTGKVATVAVDVGDRVTAGETLVTLEASDLRAQENQAEANVESLSAKLQQLRNGTRPEELAVDRAKVTSAEAALADAEQDLLNKRNDAYTKSDDAVRGKTDQLFSNPRSTSPVLRISSSNPQLESDLQSARQNLEPILVAWQATLINNPTTDNLDATVALSKTNLDRVRSFLAQMALYTNSLSQTASYSQATIDGYKTDISTARTNTNTAITNLSTSEEKVRSTNSDLAIAHAELALSEAGSTPEEISAQEAAVKEAEAARDAARAEIAKTILLSPIRGVVTIQEAKRGQIVAANAPVVSVISEQHLEIEANVPEVDVSKIALDNPVAITLDAFPNETFTGAIVHIDPAETIIDGVVNFKVKIDFTRTDPRLKSGLTANLTIKTKEHADVFLLPQYAIIENDNGTFVQKIEGTAVREVPITIGIRGQDSMVEILDGVLEGDRVLNIGIKK